MIRAEQLHGAWRLESWTLGYSDRETISTPYGEDPVGLLLYTADGWMSVSIGRRERAPLPQGVGIRNLPEAVRAAAFSSYFHYAGRYRVVDGDVVHYVTQSLNPDVPGSEQWRHVELDGHTLVLSGKDRAGGATRYHTLVWHKLAALEVVP